MKHSGILRGLGLWWLLLSVATVAAAPCDTLRVAFLTDIHVTPGNAQDSLLRIAIDEINASTCDIVLFGGDLTPGQRRRTGTRPRTDLPTAETVVRSPGQP